VDRGEQSAMNLRVGFDARWYNESGVGAYVSGLLGALSRQRGLELVVYEDPSNPVPSLNGVGVERIAVRASRYSAGEQFELARRCQADRLDLLHCPFYVMPLFASCPVVVTIHDLIPFLFPIYSRPKAAVIRQGYKMAARKAAHIITDSNATACDVQTILNVDPERRSVVHLAAAECYRPDYDEDDLSILQEKYGIVPPYLLTASARNWQTKNLLSALQALEMVKKTGAEFQTVIYGPQDGMTAAGGEERWRSLNPRYTGYVPAFDLARMFRHTIAFVMPSLYEGFGLPVLEAMSCGCAVVTANAGALTEVAGNGAQIFDPFDVAEMAAALAKLLRDEEELHRWRAAALARARDFSWQKAACETISVYHRTHKGMLSQRVASNS
jgi:glycosyltransferase involved in cell wall biosynthesis